MESTCHFNRKDFLESTVEFPMKKRLSQNYYKPDWYAYLPGCGRMIFKSLFRLFHSVDLDLGFPCPRGRS